MTKSKIPNFFKSFRGKLIIIIALVVTVILVLITQFWLKKDDNSHGEISENTNEKIPDVSKPDLNVLKQTLDKNIDSILSSFGIKKEWISTQYNTHNDKNINNSTKDADWFVKTVQIPRELSSIEVNLDISSYIHAAGLNSSASEDIISKDITITVLNPDTTVSKFPLAKINAVHSDKITRESAVFCLIINGTGEFTEEEIDKLVINKPEFSYVFPKNLDDINIQNHLLTHKNDLIINLTIGGKDNYDTDFNTSLDEKGIRERVKSFTADFSSIKNVILTRAENDIPSAVINSIADEFTKYNINVLKDSAITRLLTSAEEDSNDKISVLFNNLRSKSALAKNIAAVIRLEPDEVEKFYSEVLILKKLGYKFMNYSEYVTKAAGLEKERIEKEAKIKEEKLKDEKLKKDKKRQEKKQPEKKQPEKKQDKKKQPEKKSSEKKSTDKKKTETKKPTTNEKKKK